MFNSPAAVPLAAAPGFDEEAGLSDAEMHQTQKEYGPWVDIDWYHDDDLVTLASLDPDLTVDDLIREFELTPHSAYIQRGQQAQGAARPAGSAKGRR